MAVPDRAEDRSAEGSEEVSIKAITTARFEDGALRIHYSRAFLLELARLEGHSIRLLCQKDTRSLRQNALWWCWMTIIGTEWGWDKEDVHEYMKGKYLSKEMLHVNERTGELVETIVAGSTAELPKDEMAELMDRVKRDIETDEGILLPSSEEEWLTYEAERAARREKQFARGTL